MKNSVIDLFNLKNKIIILTGSAGVLGTEFAHTLSSVGANVILIDINCKKNKILEKTLSKKYNTNTKSYCVDISNPDEVTQLKLDILKKYKKIDGLVNNAFLNHSVLQSKSNFSTESDFSFQYWEKSLKTNLTSVFLCCKEFGSIMEKQKNGVIVNISSIYGIVGPDPRIYGKSKINAPISYAATKGSIVNLTKYLATYWHNKNIRVNTLSLGGVENKKYQPKEFIKKYSEKTVLGRMANKNDYNGAILFLLSDASSYMTGSNLIIDGGWTAW